MLSLALACTSASPPSAAPNAGPVDGDVLVVGIPMDPGSLDPLVLPYALSQVLADLVEPGLMRRRVDPDGMHFEPALAATERWSEAGDAVTFTLRDGLKWEDGAPLTSADAAFTWSLLADPVVTSNWMGDARMVAGVDTPDPQTVVFRFVAPRNRILQEVPTVRGLVPEHALRGVDRATLRGDPSARHPLASGPFRVAQWDPDDKVVLEPNPSAPADWRPHLQRIVLRVLPEYTTRLLELEQGSVDLLTEIEIADVPRLLANPRLTVVRSPSEQMQYVGWNLADPRFADLGQREALARAVDRGALIRQLFTANGEAYARPCVGTISPQLPGLVPADLAPIPFDPDAARARFADHPLNFSLMIQTGSDATRRIATWLQAAWREVGVDVAIDAVEPNRFSDRARTHDFEAILWAFGTNPTADPSMIWRTGGQYDWMGYADPATDALIDRSVLAVDPAESASALQEVQRRVYAAQPALFLFWDDGIIAIDRRFRDVEHDHFSELRHAERWWVPAAEQRY